MLLIEEFAPLPSILVLPASVFILVCTRASCLFRHELCGLSGTGLSRPRRTAIVRGPLWFSVGLSQDPAPSSVLCGVSRVLHTSPSFPRSHQRGVLLISHVLVSGLGPGLFMPPLPLPLGFCLLFTLSLHRSLHFPN